MSIQARTIVVSTGSYVAEFVEGIELRDDTVWISKGALAEGHRFEAVVSGVQTTIGASENTLENFTIYDEDGKDVTDNYTIDCILGVLEVKE